MSKLPSDHARRARALHPGQSFIVQAPAGSGKTELLVRRYLSLLAVVDRPEKILAITFTKKACAEMRERIVDALRAAEAQQDADKDDEFRAIAQAALAAAQRHDWRITENTRRLQVQTIDSFSSALVRRMPWSARFGAAPNIVENPAALYRRAAHLALLNIEDSSPPGADLSAACQSLAALVEADWGQACALLSGMLEKRDKWMRHVGAASQTLGQDDRAALESMWRDAVEAELQRIAALVAPPQQAELVALAAFAAENLRADGVDSPITALHEVREFPTARCADLAQWRGMAELALTKGGSLRKTLTKLSGFPPGASGADEKTRMLAALAALRELPDIEIALHGVRGLPGGEFSDAQWQTLSGLLRLLPVAVAQLRLLFTAGNQADFIEVTQRAGQALGDLGAAGRGDNPSELALALDYQLSHLLIDEFQDTSLAHLALIQKLTYGWQPDDGRTLFLVGDPMQSIYRFREAEVGNFLQVREAGLGDLRPAAITLESNFRSAPGLVDWFNQTFRAVLPRHDDIANSAVRYTAAIAHTEADDGRVEVHASGDPSAEAAAIAACIQDALAEDGRQSIAVLGRARSHLHAVAAALRRGGVAFQAVDLEKLAQRPAIRDLIALTLGLAQPADRIAWLCLLRAPWCGMTLHDLTALTAAAEESAQPLPNLWRDEAALAALDGVLSAAGHTRLTRFAAATACAVRQRGRDGLRLGVEGAWLALGGPAVIAAADLDDCQRYLDLLSQMEADDIDINPASLKLAAENLWARPGVDARVQLLTMHGAKGLEFDVVLLPGLSRGGRRDEKTLLRWQELPGKLLLAPLPGRAEQDDSFYRYLESLDKTRAQNEQRRLLYVACTRARRRLHLFAPIAADKKEIKPAANTMLDALWPQVGDEYLAAHAAAVAAASPAADAPESAPHPLQRLPAAWSPPPLPERMAVANIYETEQSENGAAPKPIEFSWAGETARIVGIVMHDIFQRIDHIGWENWRSQSSAEQQHAWRQLLRENGIAAEHLETALAQITQAVDNTRADAKAAWIFSPQHRAIKAEWPIAGVLDGTVAHLVVDRAFIDEHGVRWVIDFKSSRHEGGDAAAFLASECERHRPQLARYATLIERLDRRQNAAADIKLGLYFPAMRGWREVSR